SSHAFEPAADRLHGELGGVAGDPDTDETGVGGHIVHPIGHHLAELLVLEVMDVHPPWIAFRAIVASAILEVADQFPLLGVDRDDRLSLRLRGNDFRVDVVELGVSVGMFRAFIRLAVGLAREPQFHQLRAHRVGTDRMPHLRQGCGKLLYAFRHPEQRPHGIPQRRRLNQALERGDEPRVVLANRATTTTGTANPPLRQRLRVNILLAAIDRRAGQPGDLRDGRETASTSGPRLRRREQATPSLVELRADRVPSQPNGRLVDHATDLSLFAENRNPQNLSQSDAPPPDYDSVIVRSVLRFVPQQFFPASDRPELLVDLKLPEGASIEATDRAVAKMEVALKDDGDIDHWSTYVGQGAVRFYLPLDVQLASDFFAQVVIVAKDLAARERLKARLEQTLAERLPGVVTRLYPLELGPPVGWPVQYRISGPDPVKLREIAYRLANIVASDPRAQRVNFDWIEPQRTLRIPVDQDQARLLDISSQALARDLDSVVSGTTVTQV